MQGADNVDPGDVNDEIIKGKWAARPKEPAVVLKEQELKQPTSAVVTKEFCLKVLQDVAAKQPPYFNDGKFTGECRQELISQCGGRVCEWAKHFKDAASTCSSCPTDCAAQAQVGVFECGSGGCSNFGIVTFSCAFLFSFLGIFLHNINQLKPLQLLGCRVGLLFSQVSRPR